MYIYVQIAMQPKTDQVWGWLFHCVKMLYEDFFVYRSNFLEMYFFFHCAVSWIFKNLVYDCFNENVN